MTKYQDGILLQLNLLWWQVHLSLYNIFSHQEIISLLKKWQILKRKSQYVLNTLAEAEVSLPQINNKFKYQKQAFLKERSVMHKLQNVFERKILLSKNFISSTELNHLNSEVLATFGQYKPERISRTLNTESQVVKRM